MTNELAPQTLEQLMLKQDLSQLTPAQRVEFYKAKCNHIGLDPSDLPFEYIKLQGKLMLYATKHCAEQLRKKHSISIKNLRKEMDDGIYTVTVDAELPDGRTDTDCGSVDTTGSSRSDLANQKLKAVTKAKRRVTLSIIGLGMLDETEVQSIPDSEKGDAPVAANEIFQKPIEQRPTSFKDEIVTKAKQLGFEETSIPQDDFPASPPFQKVEKVKALKTRADKEFWAIKFASDDNEYTTFDSEHAAVATDLMKSGSPATYETKSNGNYMNLVSIQPA
jgi:hypothetical protein